MSNRRDKLGSTQRPDCDDPFFSMPVFLVCFGFGRVEAGRDVGVFDSNHRGEGCEIAVFI
jgi:hypothetical protein